MTALPSWAVPGRKVVCVDAKLPDRNIGRLEKNKVYTIRSVEARDYCRTGWGFHLAEINRPASTIRGHVVPFGSWRFRPVVTLEEDMLTFRSLLNTVPATNHSKETTNV